MKKVLTLILCLLYCISIVSCSQTAGHSETTDIKKLDEEQESSSSSVSTDEIEAVTSETESPPGPPTVLHFSSIAEIEEFIVASQNTEEEFYRYVATKNEYALNALPYETLLKMADNIQLCEIPIMRDPANIKEFGASYTEDYNEFAVRYIMEGVRYSFSYRFNYTKASTSDTSPVAEGVKFGNREVDIYQDDYSFYTDCSYGTVTVFINIFTKKCVRCFF
ncbi:MAG: hypothetical protein IJY39_12835 [Clostridia bacterium]|nr:hypothetical protein [Clostridia bacterium]